MAYRTVAIAKFQFLAYICSPQAFLVRPRRTKEIVERGPKSLCNQAILSRRVTDKTHVYGGFPTSAFSLEPWLVQKEVQAFAMGTEESITRVWTVGKKKKMHSCQRTEMSRGNLFGAIWAWGHMWAWLLCSLSIWVRIIVPP